MQTGARAGQAQVSLSWFPSLRGQSAKLPTVPKSENSYLLYFIRFLMVYGRHVRSLTSFMARSGDTLS